MRSSQTIATSTSTAALDHSVLQHSVVERAIACDGKLDDFIDSLRLDESEIAKTEKATRGQSENPTWVKYRNGMLTASKARRVCTRYSTFINNQEAGIPTNTNVLNTEILEGSKLDRNNLPTAIIYGLEH